VQVEPSRDFSDGSHRHSSNSSNLTREEKTFFSFFSFFVRLPLALFLLSPYATCAPLRRTKKSNRQEEQRTLHGSGNDGPRTRELQLSVNAYMTSIGKDDGGSIAAAKACRGEASRHLLQNRRMLSCETSRLRTRSQRHTEGRKVEVTFALSAITKLLL